MADDIRVTMAETTAALATFTEAKKASTAALSAVVSAFNARADRTVMAQALNAYVVAFNAMTVQTDAMRAKAALLDEQRAKWVISLENLTDGQVDEMRRDPQSYYCAGYLAICNSLLFFPKDRAMEVIDLMRSDLVQDVNNAWADFESGVTPEVPRTAVVYESGHALDLVRKALADAAADETGAS